jgi:hypothetical protein
MAVLTAGSSLKPTDGHEGPMTVWICVDTKKQVGDREHQKVFASEGAAETWFEQHDPEGVAFEYEARQ